MSARADGQEETVGAEIQTMSESSRCQSTPSYTMPNRSTENILPAADVRKRLVAANAEVRYLRRLLTLARERDEAERLRREAKSEGGRQ